MAVRFCEICGHNVKMPHSYKHNTSKDDFKRKITVYDYYDAIHGSCPWHNNELENPVKYEVEAWCVQGETGFRAFFYIDDKFCEAHGDDGSWWLVSTMNKYWVKEFKEVVNSIEVKND